VGWALVAVFMAHALSAASSMGGPTARVQPCERFPESHPRGVEKPRSRASSRWLRAEGEVPPIAMES